MTPRNRRFLIVLEGPNGVGKSTQARLVQDALDASGYNTYYYHDGENVRNYPSMDTMTLALHYAAYRAELCRDVFPDEPPGTIIIMDRFWPSTLVYQGTAANLEQIALLNRWACGDYYEADAWCFLKHNGYGDIAYRYDHLAEQFIHVYKRPGQQFVTGYDTHPERTCAQIIEFVEPKIAAWQKTLGRDADDRP